MKRKILVILETLLIIFISIGIISIIFSGYYIFKGLGKSIVNVNENNRNTIESMLKESKEYEENNNIKDLKKIQFFMNFNDFEFTLYYKDNIKVELYDDDLYSLKSYVEKNGYSKSSFYIGIDAAIILGCVGLNGIKKKISDEIDLLDKQEENYIS